MPSGLNKTEKKERREEVALLCLQGYTDSVIAGKTGLTAKQVRAHRALIKRQHEPKKIWPVEYYRNKARHQIGLGISKAWDIYEANIKNPSICLSALRVIKEFNKLLAEVDGIISEKMPTTAPKEAAALLKAIRELDVKAKSVPEKDGGDGQGEVATIPLEEIIPSES